MTPPPFRLALLALLASPLLVACARSGGDSKTPRSSAGSDWTLPEGWDAAASRGARRILPASATAVDLVAELVGPERVAGLPEQALEYSALHDPPAAWAELPRFSRYLAEPVLALRPDLVVADPWNAPDTTQRLRETGVPLLLLPEIASWADARRALVVLGDALGVEERARSVVEALDRRVAALEAGAGPRRGLRALVYSNFGAQGYTSGSRTTMDDAVRLTGMVNAAAEAGLEGAPTITFEELLALDPDLFLVSEPLKMPAGRAGDRGGAAQEVLLTTEALASLRAVRERRIVSLPAWLIAAGSHRVVRGAEVLAERVDRLLAERGR